MTRLRWCWRWLLTFLPVRVTVYGPLRFTVRRIYWHGITTGRLSTGKGVAQ